MPAMSGESKPRIVVSERISDSGMARLKAAGEVVFLEKCDEATLIKVVTEANALVIRTYSEVTEKVILAAQKAGQLRVIGRAGVGVDNIDLRAAKRAGIPVVHTPAACTDAVGDFTVGLIVAVQRRIVSTDSQVRKGEFAKLRSSVPLFSELQHQTLGVIGMGRIGTAVSKRMCHGFGMRIIYYDIREIGWLPFPAKAQASAEAVYAEAEVITLHVPLTELTRQMINAKALSHFKSGSFLVNTSRGPVVEAQSLAEALKENRLAGAAIDVFDPEPPPPDHPLRLAPNCVLTPHIGARSKEGLEAMNDVVDDVIGVLQGKPPMYPADLELS